MNIDRWIAIAAIIVSLLTAVWQVRTARQMANPDRVPPKILRSAIAKIIGAVKKFWALVVGLGLPVFGILWELSRPGDADDVSLFFIVMFAVTLSFEVSMLGALVLYAYALKRLTATLADGGEKG